MSDNVIVQFVGFEAKALVREYNFYVRQASSETREFTLTIVNEALIPGAYATKTLPRSALYGSTVSWPLIQTVPRKHITVSARSIWTSTATPTHQRLRATLISPNLPTAYSAVARNLLSELAAIAKLN